MPLQSTETRIPHFTSSTGSQAVDLFISHAAFSLQSQADQIERNVLPSQISRNVDHQIAVDACAELCEDQLCVKKKTENKAQLPELPVCRREGCFPRLVDQREPDFQF